MTSWLLIGLWFGLSSVGFSRLVETKQKHNIFGRTARGDVRLQVSFITNLKNYRQALSPTWYIFLGDHESQQLASPENNYNNDNNVSLIANGVAINL